MRSDLRVVVAMAVLIASAQASRAADICEAVALRDVPAIEDPTSILSRGQRDTAITQYRVNKKTGVATFCSHGGYCYPTHLTVDGKKVEALRLTNCKVGKRMTDNDPDDIYYDVDVIRSKVPAATLRYDDLDNKLLGLGLCSACASNAAELYLRKPNSACARLVKRALEGNPVAIKVLVDNFPDYCSL
jgi:hypothetical protein